MLLLYYTPFKILICIHGIIVNSDLVYQHLCETEHLYYLFGSSSKRIIPLCHLVDDIQVLTLNKTLKQCISVITRELNIIFYQNMCVPLMPLKAYTCCKNEHHYHYPYPYHYHYHYYYHYHYHYHYH